MHTSLLSCSCNLSLTGYINSSKATTFFPWKAVSQWDFSAPSQRAVEKIFVCLSRGIWKRRNPESRIQNRNRNRNLRNKNWRCFCLESVTNNNIIAQSRLFVPILYLFIVIIFFTVALFTYGAKFFFENFIYA